MFFLAASFYGQAQEYLRMIDNGNYPVEEVINSAEAYFENRDKGRGTGYKPYKRWEYNALRMVKEDGRLPNIEERLSELEQWNSHLNETAGSRRVLPDSWQDLGPSSWNATSSWSPGVGRITALAFENGNIDHMIIGANTGGVWRSTDGAQNWTHLTDYFSHLSVYSVAIHPLDSNIYFFGSHGGNIFKSMDSGATWHPVGVIGNSLVNKILIHPTNPNVIFATAENSGIYRSDDGGENWVKAVTNDNRGFDIEFKVGDTSVVYASGNGFHKSVDGGITFTTIGGFSDGPKMIGVSDADPARVYVVEANQSIFGGLYRSYNSGSSFEQLDHDGMNYFGYSVTAQDGLGQAPRDMAIAVNPANADEVHIAGILPWRSMNAGVDFTITADWIPNNAANQNIGYCHADVDDLVFNGTTLFAITDGGIFKAENTETINANYFEDITTGLSIRQFYKIGVSQTENVIVVGGSQDNGTSFYKETTGEWKDWLGADGMEAFIDKDNSNMFFGTSQFGALYRSLDGGLSYHGINRPGGSEGNWVTPFEQDPIQANTIYVGYKFVYKSTNSGGSWAYVSQDFGANLDHLKIAPSNNQVMYASLNHLLYKTEDGGATAWTSSNPGGRINSIAVHPTNPNKVAVALTSSKRVVVSEDGGETWVNYKKNLPNFSALALVWDDNGNDGLYLGMDYGIYYIDNTFEEWQPYNNLLPNVIINELEINNETRMLYAGTYGRGLWVSPLVARTVGTEDLTFQNGVSLHPNPATSEVMISTPFSTNGEVRVFDSLGKLLIYDHNAILGNSYSLNISALSSGTYFVRLNTPNGEVTKKLIKQ